MSKPERNALLVRLMENGVNVETVARRFDISATRSYAIYNAFLEARDSDKRTRAINREVVAISNKLRELMREVRHINDACPECICGAKCEKP